MENPALICGLFICEPRLANSQSLPDIRAFILYDFSLKLSAEKLREK